MAYDGLVFIALYTYRAALDNYKPSHREEANGRIEHWLHQDTNTHKYVLHGHSQFRREPRGIFLLDSGRTVVPLYTAGWHAERDTLILHHMPTNVDADGEPRLRADNSRPVDYTNWTLGPRVAYHLKITEV